MIRWRVAYRVTGGDARYVFVLARTERAARSKAADMAPDFCRILQVTK
jgi:hypothetical protein